MRRRSPILETLADLYAESSMGLTGVSSRAYSVRFEPLLRAARCETGDDFANALSDLESSDGKALVLVRHPRSKDIQRVQVPFQFEEALFSAVGRPAPAAEREAWAALFLEAAEWPVPAAHAASWRWFCQRRAAAVNRGEGWQPFRRRQRSRARPLLEVIARLLAWRQPALLRTVSAQLAGNSKFLERSAGAIEQLLAESTDRRIRALADLQIHDNPRSVRIHGPVRLFGHSKWVDLTNQTAPAVSEIDVFSASQIECDAPRCVTVENETKFHELCRLRCGDLFVLTSYPNRATVEFLRRLPPTLPRFHFGDTDPWGFDVLRSLRNALPGIAIAPLHMHFRPKIDAVPLTDRDRRKLRRLLGDSLLADVWPELRRMEEVGSKGDFEQESILVQGGFPYCAGV